MSEPVAGKFLLEILTKGMYSNPMHIYREYIQNATDAIDAAVQAGLIQMPQAVIHITVNARKAPSPSEIMELVYQVLLR